MRCFEQNRPYMPRVILDLCSRDRCANTLPQVFDRLLRRYASLRDPATKDLFDEARGPWTQPTEELADLLDDLLDPNPETRLGCMRLGDANPDLCPARLLLNDQRRSNSRVRQAARPPSRTSPLTPTLGRALGLTGVASRNNLSRMRLKYS